MKYIKSFESIENNPQLGDYVICKEYVPYVTYITRQTEKDDLDNFINNGIGRFIKIGSGDYCYIIKYDNIPEDLLNNFRYRDTTDITFNGNGCRAMKRDEIIEFANTKNELKIKSTASKYNL